MSISQNLPNLAIGYSLARLFKLLGAGLLATLLCGALAFSLHYGKDIATIQIALSYFGIVFFGLATCKTLRQGAGPLHHPCRHSRHQDRR
jgi:hypothetical protein